jgi:hypothetical protein
MRVLTVSIALVCLAGVPAIARAQAPPGGPLVLRVPASPRAAALGNAWVAGRDQDVVFYNPAQLIGARQSFDLSLTRHGPASTHLAVGGVYAGGRMSFTLGWGVQTLSLAAPAGTGYPFDEDALLSEEGARGDGTLVVVGGAVVYRGLRIGAAGKYVSDRTSVPGDQGLSSTTRHALRADVGVARNLFGGVAAVSVQNLGRTSQVSKTPTAPEVAVTIPIQMLAGWSTTRAAGPLDLGLFSQVLVRDEWTAPGGGVDVGYSWIEGYAVAVRVGARRPESATEHPWSIGAAFTADRLTVEYAVRFFEGGRAVNGVTFRWR